ncbi:MAG: hypothetical protein ABW168_05420 [Sedimenticola sp.]
MRSSFTILIFQSLGALIQLYTLRLLDNVLTNSELGFWLTIMTISSWISITDFGISNGLRNKLASLFSISKVEEAKIYISSVYKYMLIILLLVFVIGVAIALISERFEWYELEIVNEFDATITIIFLLLGTVINLYFSINSAVSYALLKPVYKSLVLFVFHFVFCILIWSSQVFSYDGEPLVLVSFYYFFSALVINAVSAIYFYTYNNKLIPELNHADYKRFSEIMSVGLNFLVIQIAAVILFSTDTVLIANMFEFSDVTTYKVSTRLYFLFVMIQGALLSPIWSKYTQYCVKKDCDNIFSELKKSLLITLILFILILAFYHSGTYIISYWFGHTDYYDEEVFFAMAVLVTLMNWSSNFSTLFNGIGAIKNQVYLSVLAMFLNIPISIALVNLFGFGMEGVVYGTIVSLSIFAIYAPFKAKKYVTLSCECKR